MFSNYGFATDDMKQEKRLVKIELDDGTTVLIEAVDDPKTPMQQAGSDIPTIDAESFEKAAEAIKKVTGAVFGKLKDMGPDEVEVTVGVKLTTAAGVIIAQAGSEASFQIKCKWKNSKDDD